MEFEKVLNEIQRHGRFDVELLPQTQIGVLAGQIVAIDIQVFVEVYKNNATLRQTVIVEDVAEAKQSMIKTAYELCIAGMEVE